MAKRKPIDIKKLRRDDAQVDGIGDGTNLPQQPRQVGRRARRVETLPLSIILPDRYQPRPLLPSWIRVRFFAGEISCYEAAQAWLTAAKEDAGINNRVNGLLAMGTTFDAHGQIKPITGMWQDLNGERLFVIETGERRYWAACLLAVREGHEEEPTLQVLAVPQAARERQVIENQHAEPPTAVGRAREIAALLLDAADIYPSQPYVDDYDYFRTALGMRHRMKTWAHLEEILGVSRPYMSRLLKVLQLPTHLLELADHYQVPERVLREMMDLPPEEQENMLLHVIQHGGTHEDVAMMVAKQNIGDDKRKRRQKDPSQKAARRLRGVFRSLVRTGQYEKALSALATSLVIEVDEIEDLLQIADMLDDLATQVRARVGR